MPTSIPTTIVNANSGLSNAISTQSTQTNSVDFNNSGDSGMSFNQMLKNEMQSQGSAKTTPSAPASNSATPSSPTSETTKKTNTTKSTPDSNQPQATEQQNDAEQIASDVAATVGSVLAAAAASASSNSTPVKSTDTDADEKSAKAASDVIAALDNSAAAISDVALMPMITKAQPGSDPTASANTKNTGAVLSSQTVTLDKLAGADANLEKAGLEQSGAKFTDREASTKFNAAIAETKNLHENSDANSDAKATKATEAAAAFNLQKTINSSTNAAASDSTILNNVQNIKNANQNLNESQLNAIAPVLIAPPALSAVDGTNAANAANLAHTIYPPVGTSDWDQAIGQKINWMVAGAQQSASLTLNPPELGPLQVVINVNNQHANATFISHQPEVRTALENAIPKLREMMEQSGIQLGECNVSSQAKPQQEFAQRQSNSNRAASVNAIGSTAVPIQTQRSVIGHGGIGIVDTFV